MVVVSRLLAWPLEEHRSFRKIARKWQQHRQSMFQVSQWRRVQVQGCGGADGGRRNLPGWRSGALALVGATPPKRATIQRPASASNARSVPRVAEARQTKMRMQTLMQTWMRRLTRREHADGHGDRKGHDIGTICTRTFCVFSEVVGGSGARPRGLAEQAS